MLEDASILPAEEVLDYQDLLQIGVVIHHQVALRCKDDAVALMVVHTVGGKPVGDGNNHEVVDIDLDCLVVDLRDILDGVVYMAVVVGVDS